MDVEELKTPHYTEGREGHSPRGIVVHTTVGSFSSAVNWFTDPASGVSAHYLVGLSGRVARFVQEDDTAQHAFRVHEPSTPLVTHANPNFYTVGIEFEDGGDPHGVDRPDEQYQAGAELIHAVASRWGIPLDHDHVVGHRRIYSLKTCPGNLDVERLIVEAHDLPSG